MRTSVNIPDWLHNDATTLMPDVSFSALVTDALLIARATWQKDARQSPAEARLAMKVRAMQSEALRAGVRIPRVTARNPTATRVRAASAPEPDTRPVGRPARAAKSQTTASARKTRRKST